MGQGRVCTDGVAYHRVFLGDHIGDGLVNISNVTSHELLMWLPVSLSSVTCYKGMGPPNVIAAEFSETAKCKHTNTPAVVFHLVFTTAYMLTN